LLQSDCDLDPCADNASCPRESRSSRICIPRDSIIAGRSILVGGGGCFHGQSVLCSRGAQCLWRCTYTLTTISETLDGLSVQQGPLTHAPSANMSAPLTQDNIDSKVEVEDHIEDLKEDPQAQPGANILSSGVAALTTRQAMRRFWRLLLIGFSVSVSGM
jgi:hypothetical protein